jgi:hypothetical protein
MYPLGGYHFNFVEVALHYYKNVNEASLNNPVWVAQLLEFGANTKFYRTPMLINITINNNLNIIQQ